MCRMYEGQKEHVLGKHQVAPSMFERVDGVRRLRRAAQVRTVVLAQGSPATCILLLASLVFLVIPSGR